MSVIDVAAATIDTLRPALTEGNAARNYNTSQRGHSGKVAITISKSVGASVMDITRETQQQLQQRLGSVLQAADIAWLPGHFAFTETANPEAVMSASRRALAVIRDEDRWSVLDEADEKSAERFRVFTCHFNADIPNSGFVGWLASEIKRELGSGVFVVCGHNRQRGGIFDYWGVPSEVATDVLHLLEKLRRGSHSRSNPSTSAVLLWSRSLVSQGRKFHAQKE